MSACITRGTTGRVAGQKVRRTALALSLSLMTGSVLVAASRAAHAQAARTFTWTGASGSNGSGVWENNGNWDSGLYPDSTTTAASFVTGVANTLIGLTSNHNLYGITFGYNSSNTATNFTIGGKGTRTLNLYNGGITDNVGGNATQTIDVSLALQTSQSFSTVAGGTLALTAIGANNQIDLLGNTLNIVGAGNTNIASTIVDSSNNGGQISETSTGILTLSNIGNSFTGSLAINQGTLVAAASQTSLNPGTSVLGSTQTAGRSIIVGDGTNAATLQFAASQVFGTGNSNPQGTMVINAGSTVTNAGSQFNILPNLVLSGGTLTGTGGMSSSQQMYSFAFGTITVGGSAMSTISGSGTNSGYHLGGSTTFNVADVTGDANTDLLVSGSLIDNFNSNGAGSLVKTGAGTMTLTGTNTYTGTTTINGGTLQVGNGGNVGTLGSGAVIDNATLTFYRPGSATIANAISGSGSLVVKNGTVTLTGANTYTGGTMVSGGYLYVGNNTISSSLGNSTGNVTINGGLLVFNAASSAGTATITNNTGLIFSSTSSAGSATINSSSGKIFSGTFACSFNNSASAGNATINNSGNLYFNDTSSADSGKIANSFVLDLSAHSGGLSIGELNGAGSVYLGGNALTVGSANTSDTISGIIQDGGYQSYDSNGGGTGGSLVKTGGGTLTLTGNNTYTGGTTVNAGNLFVGTNTSGGSLGSGPITNNSVLDFNGSSSAGSASITNNGGATLIFNTSSSAGSAGTSLTNSGSAFFLQQSSTGSTNITNNNGGSLYLQDTSTAAGSTIVNGSGAKLDLSFHNGGLSVGELSGAGTVYLGGNALTVGGAVTSVNVSDTISGVIQDGNSSGSSGGTGGSLIKAGSGTLTLTGNNTYTGGTTVGGGTLAAQGGALGTGGVSITSGATLAVGEAVNAAGTSLTTHSLNDATLSVVLGSSTPLLTFNLGTGSTSDVLNLTSTSATDLTFSGSGTFTIGFASATGSSLGPGKYTLINFANPEATSNAPAINSYQAVAKGNLARINGGSFAYQTNSSGGITGLNFTIGGSADALPEPRSLWLLAPTVIGLFGFGRRKSLS